MLLIIFLYNASEYLFYKILLMNYEHFKGNFFNNSIKNCFINHMFNKMKFLLKLLIICLFKIYVNLLKVSLFIYINVCVYVVVYVWN